MKRAIFTLVMSVLFLSALSGAAFAQTRYTLPADQIIPGRPWTSMVPDPDKFDWSAKNGVRPGYRYRGMLPMQKKFYDYIQEKNRANIPLNSAEESTIRWLIKSRRWPDAPKPNAFWAAFMRYLRAQTTIDLNVAQSIMVDQLLARGLVPVDMKPNANFSRVRDYLNSGPFQPRNWFERAVGRVEPWMDNYYSGFGYDMRTTSSPSGNAFPPGDPFNGLKVSYNVSGATLSAPVDGGSFTITRSYEGVLGTGTLTVSGTARVGGYGADVSLSVWAGDKKEEKKFYIENVGSGGNPKSFSLSVPIPAGARTGGFAIHLDGRYSMGGGHRGCYVTGNFGPSKAQLDADRAAADAKWRKEVEDTLNRLGYQNTPEGKEAEEMRKALAGGDAGWKAFVDKRLDQMNGDDSPKVLEYRELESAIENGGEEWDKYVAAHAAGEKPADEATVAVKSGEALHTEKKYSEAIKKFDEAIKLDPKKSEAYRLRGRSKRESGDLNGSLADFNRAMELEPNNYQSILGRGLTRDKLGDRAGAMSDFDRGISLNPNYSGGYAYRGRLKFDLKDYTGAKADFDRAIALDPKSASAYINRGLSKANLNDRQGAIADYTRAIEADPKSAIAYNNRGVMKQQLGDLNGALADYQAALAINPNYQTARSNLEKIKPKIAVQGGVSNPQAGAEAVIFNNGNIGGVLNSPTVPTQFVISQPQTIASVSNYHWNNGRGTTKPGTISLRGADGRLYGPWPTIGTPGQGGVPNAYWEARPNVVIPAGTYTIVDSNPSTWSQNRESGGRGLSIVKGSPAGGNVPVGDPVSTAGRYVTAIFENRSSENAHIFVEGGTFGAGNRLAPGQKRDVKVMMAADGRIKFNAGRNGQVIATKIWNGDPDDLSRFPRVVFDGRALAIMTGLR